jgi:hypothetical protein
MPGSHEKHLTIGIFRMLYLIELDIFHFSASLLLMYPEGSMSVPGPADVEVIIFRSVLIFCRHRTEANCILQTDM